MSSTHAYVSDSESMSQGWLIIAQAELGPDCAGQSITCNGSAGWLTTAPKRSAKIVPTPSSSVLTDERQAIGFDCWRQERTGNVSALTKARKSIGLGCSRQSNMCTERGGNTFAKGDRLGSIETINYMWCH